MDRAIDIIKSLSTQSYTTSKALAEQLNVSSRTIRNDVRLLNQELKKNGAYIESVSYTHLFAFRLFLSENTA